MGPSVPLAAQSVQGPGQSDVIMLQPSISTIPALSLSLLPYSSIELTQCGTLVCCALQDMSLVEPSELHAIRQQ